MRLAPHMLTAVAAISVALFAGRAYQPAQAEEVPPLSATQIAAQEKGAFAIGYNSPTANAAPKAYMTAPLFKWATFYTKDVEAILNGTWKNADYDGCKVTNEITGDVDKFYQSMKNQVVKEITYVDGKAQMTRELVDFSTAELDQALFSLDGYKKVTDAEFQAAQQQKMMQMYMPK